MTAPDPTENGRRRAFPSAEVPDPGRFHGDCRLGLEHVLRGLSALFWAIPLALLAFARHFLAFLPTLYDLVLPTIGAGLAFYGLMRLGRYQRRERVWQNSLLLSQTLALLVLGLSPFLFLWSRVPSVAFFARAVVLLLAVALIFLVAFLGSLERLAAMLPDDTVRGDARLFRGLSAYLVAVLAGVGVTLYWRLAPGHLSDFLEIPRQPLGLGRHGILLLLILIPVAMSMAVTWKLKEVVLAVMVGWPQQNPAAVAGAPGQGNLTAGPAGPVQVSASGSRNG